MAEKVKRDRGSNFSSSEIESLIGIVGQYKNVLECKKTDATTWRQKDTAWETVAQEFNCCSGEGFRSKKALKSKYDDLKKTVKKKLAHNRMENFKTGGGAPQMQKLTAVEETVFSMLPSVSQGNPSLYDDDEALGIFENEESVNKTLNENQDDNMHVEKNSPTKSLEELDFDLLASFDKENEPDMTASTWVPPKKKRNVAETGVAVLRKSVTPELRVTKKGKKNQQEFPSERDAREKEMREELHAMRMKILKTELQIKDNQLFAELELRELEKKIKEAELNKLYEN